MCITMNLDETLIAEAQRLTGIAERDALIHAGLRALIERGRAQRQWRRTNSAR
jgi:Arc/MetJ family transcription regulator